jgi:Uma2 family endonuclease
VSTVTEAASARVGPFTREELWRQPEDGRRWEIIDGVLIVTPVPGLMHQRAVGALVSALHAACPSDLELLVGPFAVGIADDTELRPDLLVAPRDAFAPEELPGCPTLTIEVSEACTRVIDVHLKRERLERAGAQSYWVFDAEQPRLTAWEIQLDGR